MQPEKLRRIEEEVPVRRERRWLACGAREVGRLSNNRERPGPLGQVSSLIIVILAEAATLCADGLETNARREGAQQIHAQGVCSGWPQAQCVRNERCRS